MNTKPKTKPTVYFAGSITGGRDDAALYNKIISLISAYATVLTEHIGSVALGSIGEADKTPEFIHDRDMQWLAEADAVIAEVTSPSLGVGYELRFVEEQQKPALCLWRDTGRTLSRMITGSAYLGPRVHQYDEGDLVALEARLRIFFEKL